MPHNYRVDLDTVIHSPDAIMHCLLSLHMTRITIFKSQYSLSPIDRILILNPSVSVLN